MQPNIADIAAGLSEAQRVMLNKQMLQWPSVLKGAALGNPYATLCQHCMGRHKPLDIVL